MNQNILKQFSDTIREHILKYELSDAIHTMKALVAYSDENILNDELESISSNYSRMLDFLGHGGEDDKRNEVQQSIATNLLDLLTKVHRKVRILYIPDQYSRVLAATTERHTRNGIFAEWNQCFSIKERIGLQNELFYMIWTSPMWEKQDTALWYDFISRQEDMAKIHFLGAVFLASWEYFDEEKITLLALFSNIAHEETKIHANAFMGLLCIKYSREITWRKDHLQVYRKHRQDIAQVFGEILLIHLTKLSVQAESEELRLMKPNGISEAIQIKGKYTKERLENGMDCNFEKISLLHSSTFLKEIANWWIPFDSTHPMAQRIRINSEGKELKKIATALTYNYDCAVDKYAICEALHTQPPELRQMLDKAHKDLQIKQGGSPSPEIIVKLLIQNLYRFFEHSPLKGEVDSPFQMGNRLVAFRFVKDLQGNEENFRLGKLLSMTQFFEQACIFLEDHASNEEVAFYLAFAKIKLGAYTECIEILKNRHFDDEKVQLEVNRMLAESYKKIGDSPHYILSMKKIAEATQAKEDMLSLAAAMEKADKYKDEYALLSKCNYLFPHDTDILMPLAVAAFRVNKMQYALKHAKELTENKQKLRPEFFTLYALLLLSQQEWTEAVSQITVSCSLFSVIETKEAFQDLRKLAVEFGLSALDLSLINDIIHHHLEE